MAKFALFLAVPLLLAAPAAHAQSTAADKAALADVPPPVTQAEPAKGTTVPGVVVKGTPMPKTKCKPNDRACIIAIAKAVWDQYPEQTRMYCSQEKMRALNKRANMEAFFAGNASQVVLDSDYMPPALEVVCAYGELKARDEKAAATEKPAVDDAH